jgi:hypothetical protein
LIRAVMILVFLEVSEYTDKIGTAVSVSSADSLFMLPHPQTYCHIPANQNGSSTKSKNFARSCQAS